MFQTISGQTGDFNNRNIQVSPPKPQDQGKKQMFLIKGGIPNAVAQAFDSAQKFTLASPSGSKGLQSVNLSLSASKGYQSGLKVEDLQQGEYKENQQSAKGSAEKSYTDASLKIMKIKQLEQDNKISLLVIENERLNSFLNDAISESERLNEEVYKWQIVIKQDQEKYAQKLSYLLTQNQQLEDVNKKLQNRIQDLLNDKKDLGQVFQEEIQGYKDQYLMKQAQDKEGYEINMNNLKNNFDNLVAQLKDKLSRTEHQVSDLKKEVAQDSQMNAELETRINILIQENLTLTNIIKNQEIATQKLLFQLDNVSNDFQQSVNKYERDIRDSIINNKQNLEQLHTQHLAEIQTSKQQKFQEINEQLEELCSELGTKEVKIRNLEKVVENIQKSNESQRRRENQNNIELHENQKQVQSHLEHERGILLNEIDTLSSNQSLLEASIVKHTKTIIAREKSMKALKGNLQDAQAEALKIQNNLKNIIVNNETEINTYKNKLDIVLSENESLRGQIRNQQRDIDIMTAKVNSIDMEWDQRLKKSRQEQMNQKDKQFEDIYNEQLETLNKEHQVIQKLEKRLVEQQEVRTSLESQLASITKSDLLADQKIKELLKQNALLEKENFTYRDEALASKQDAKVALNKLAIVQKNCDKEKNEMKVQMQKVNQQNEITRSQNQELQARMEEISHQLEQISNAFDDIQGAKNKAQSEILKLAEKCSNLEKKNKDLIKAQQIQLSSQLNDSKQSTETTQKVFVERESDLLNKIKEQQFSVEQITEKYNDLLQKARKYRQHILLLREANHNGKVKEVEFNSTKRTIMDNLYDEIDENELDSLKQSQTITSPFFPKVFSHFKSNSRIVQATNVYQNHSNQQRTLVRPCSVQMF